MRFGLLIAAAVVLAGELGAQDTLSTRAAGPPLWGEAPQLVEQARIGVVDGEPEYALGHVIGVAVDPQGVIWVADSQSAELRRYDERGEFLSLVGSKGDGPGEFRGLSGVRVMPDGRVAAFDAHRGRINFFSQDGAYLGGVQRSDPIVVVGGPGDVFQVGRGGQFYLYSLRPRPRSDPGRARGLWLELDSSGVVIDSIVVPPSGSTTVGGRSYPFGPMAAFTPVTMSVLTRDGTLVTARNDEYVVYRPLRDGRILRIDREWEPVEVQPDEREQYRLRAQTFAERWDPAYGFGTDIPSHKPPFWALRVDEEDRIWVARHSMGMFLPETPDERNRREQFGNPPFEWWEPLVVDVLGRRGQHMGTLRFPNPRTNVAAARGETVWAVELGEFDEQYVVRYAIQPSR